MAIEPLPPPTTPPTPAAASGQPPAHSMSSGPGATPASHSLCTSSLCGFLEQASAGPQGNPTALEEA